MKFKDSPQESLCCFVWRVYCAWWLIRRAEAKVKTWGEQSAIANDHLFRSGRGCAVQGPRNSRVELRNAGQK